MLLCDAFGEMHWQIKGRRRRVSHTPPPATGPNSFIFAYVCAEKLPRRRLAPPPTGRHPLPPPTGNLRSATEMAGVDLHFKCVVLSGSNNCKRPLVYCQITFF